MDIRCRFVAGVTILDLVGRLVAGSRCPPLLRAVVGDLIEKGRVVVLVHMTSVTDMDAHGMGTLVSSLTTLERHGGQMALIAPSAHVRRLLALTRLDTVFTVYDSEREALVRSCPAAVTTALRDRDSWSGDRVVFDGRI